MIRQIAFLIYPDFQLLDAAGPIAAFEMAARYEQASYTMGVNAAERGLVTSSSGASMQARPFGRARGIDTLVIAGGDGSRSAVSCAKTLRFIRHCAGHARRTTSVCSGSYLLAAAGLPAGKRAPPHCDPGPAFSPHRPPARVGPPCIFVHAGSTWTPTATRPGISLSPTLR